MAAVILNVSAARRGQPSISLTGLLVDITPADAFHLAESFRMAADWAAEIDEGADELVASDVLSDAGIG